MSLSTNPVISGFAGIFIGVFIVRINSFLDKSQKEKDLLNALEIELIENSAILIKYSKYPFLPSGKMRYQAYEAIKKSGLLNNKSQDTKAFIQAYLTIEYYEQQNSGFIQREGSSMVLKELDKALNAVRKYLLQSSLLGRIKLFFTNKWPLNKKRREPLAS